MIDRGILMPQQRDRARLDLSLTQVAASALAAIVGAVLASELGVYGTIIGAAVVSVGATTGGAVFQHLFKRTGEQLRSAVEQPSTEPAPLGEWNEPRTLRSKSKRRWTWKTYAAVSALVFALAMTPILVVELATGKTVSSMTGGDDKAGTSLVPRQQKSTPPPSEDKQDKKEPSRTASPSPSAGKSSGTPSSTPSGRPSGSPSGSPSPSVTPSVSPSAPTTSPTPTTTPTDQASKAEAPPSQSPANG